LLPTHFCKPRLLILKTSSRTSEAKHTTIIQQKKRRGKGEEEAWFEGFAEKLPNRHFESRKGLLFYNTPLFQFFLLNAFENSNPKKNPNNAPATSVGVA